MEYILIIIICILAIFVLKFAFQVKIKDIKKIKQIGYDKRLNEMTDAFPENKIVCEDILKQLGNATVHIKESEDKDNKLSYYSVITNNIIIANIKDTFTRIQTIAHECIHSIQNRKTLLFNFIFSNIYLLYFFIISILTLTNVVKEPMIQIAILGILGIIYYGVRSYLETEAMTKAPYVARKYMEETQKLTNEEIEFIIKNYMELNKIGIPMTNFYLIISVMVKIVIYCVIAIIVH